MGFADITVAKGPEKDKQNDTPVKVHRIRITLTSRHVKNVEKGTCPEIPSQPSSTTPPP
jgi:hypothetical protein